jgi:hypothetical protein
MLSLDELFGSSPIWRDQVKKVSRPIKRRPKRPPVRMCSTHNYTGGLLPEHVWCATCEGIYQRTNNAALRRSKEEKGHD